MYTNIYPFYTIKNLRQWGLQKRDGILFIC